MTSTISTTTTTAAVSSGGGGGYVSQSELIELMEFCRRLFLGHRSIDYYATTIGIGLVVVFGVLGNAGTLLTLSGRRLTTATFVYYRAIAWTDLIRCVFVVSYILRVMIPFRNYYATTWYEAHLMYFIINTLSFVSTSLAVTLCVRLCIGILQSRRLKKTKTNPKTTRIFVYLIVGMALIVNCCLCYEYEAVNSMDYCVRNRTVNPNEYMIQETSFHIHNDGLLKAIHVFPMVILLVLICGAASILLCCFFAMPRSTTTSSSASASSSRKATLAQQPPPPTPRTSTNALLVHHCPSVRQSRPWRTQRQLCKLFLLLSLCYALGLLPGFLNMIIYSKHDSASSSSCNNCTSSENYKTRIRQHFDRANSASVSNIFQNIGHALSFYVYVSCSDAFRAEFLVKLRRMKSRFFSAIWPYSRALGCTSIGALLSEKMSQSASDTKQALRSVTLLAELESEEGALTTFAPQQVIMNDHSMEMIYAEETSLAAAALASYTPVFTVAGARRTSTHLYSDDGDIVKPMGVDNRSMADDLFADQLMVGPGSIPLEPLTIEPPLRRTNEEIPPHQTWSESALVIPSEILLSDDRDSNPQSLSPSSLSSHGRSEIISPVQLQPHRYQRFYSSDGKKRDSQSME